MDFAVEIVALKNLPPTLDRLADDAYEGNAYVQTNTSLEYREGLLNRIKRNHEDVVRQTTYFLQDIEKYTARQTSNALRQAIAYYESTDAAAAGRLDATYRGANVDRSQFAIYYRSTDITAPFADRAEPQSHYAPIADYNKDENFQFAPQLWDIAGPASAARDAIWSATWLGAKMGICDRAYDPHESLVKPIAGDWACVRGCADVFANISTALADMAANVHWTAFNVDGVWSGQSATAFQAHLIWSAEKLADAGGPLAVLAEAYKTVSAAMFEIGNVVASLISDIVDAALIFAAEASLAAATSETVVGGVVFGTAALYEGYKMSHMIKECLDLVGRADSLTSALNSSAGSFGLVDGARPLPVLAPPPTLPA